MLLFIKVSEVGSEYLCRVLPRQLVAVSLAIACEMDEDNTVNLGPNTRGIVAAKCGLQSASLKPLLSRLLSYDVLHRVSIGVYMVNPWIFSKTGEDETDKLRAMYPDGVVYAWLCEEGKFDL